MVRQREEELGLFAEDFGQIPTCTCRPAKAVDLCSSSEEDEEESTEDSEMKESTNAATAVSSE